MWKGVVGFLDMLMTEWGSAGLVVLMRVLIVDVDGRCWGLSAEG